MAFEFRSIMPALAAVSLMCAPQTGLSEGMWAQRNSAQATLAFQVIIPAVLQVLEDSHPTNMQPTPSGNWSGQQRLVVMSNMKRGFCVTLRLGAPDVTEWKLRSVQADEVQLDPVVGGYRLCAARAGRYTLVLDHQFESGTAANFAAEKPLNWPIQTEVTAL